MQPAKELTLADPPLVAHHLLEAPVPTMVILTAAGVIAAYLLHRAARVRPALLCLLAGPALAALVFTLATLATTQREVLQDRTRQLINAAATGSSSELASLLDPAVTLRILETEADWTRDEIVSNTVDVYRARYQLESVSTGRVLAELSDANHGITLAAVRVSLTYEGLQTPPTQSHWRLSWRKATTGDWLAVGIEGVAIQGVESVGTLR